jgi:lysophospholipase L1-like esterase
MRRLLACALIAAAAVLALPVAAFTMPVAASETAPDSSAGPAEMEWAALNRFGGDADGDGRFDSPVTPTLAAIEKVAVRVAPSAPACRLAGRATWRVDGREWSGVEVQDGAGDAGCEALLAVPESARRIEMETPAGREVARVELEDRLVVAVGDSVASGEGNPQGPERWLDPPCHRSAVAGFEQAARLLGQSLASEASGRSLTFVSFACSGAEIDIGLLGPYVGIAPEPGRQPYPPQVERLRRVAAGRSPDAILLNVGANDLGFSRIVTICATSISHCSGELEPRLLADQARLSDNYDRLGSRLRQAAPGTPVLITEYFDPTHDELGRFCGHSVGATTRAEAQWAHEAVLRPLNAEIEAAATRNGWRFVSGIAADFERHGYCAHGGERWVRLLTASAARQLDHNGTMHPSRPGHAAIARRVARPLAAELGLAVPSLAIEAEGRTALEWIASAALVAVGSLAVQQHWLVGLGPLGTWPLLIGLTIVASLLLGLLLLIAWAIVRLLRLWRPTWPPDPFPDPAERPRIDYVLGPRQLALLGGAAIAAGLLATILTGLAGRLILWLRFWSANLPADQAADAVPASELVVVGSQALGVFIILALFGVGIAWLLDGKGRWVRETRRGLVLIGLVEIWIAIRLGDFGTQQALELAVGLTLAGLLVHYLVDTVLAFKVEVDNERAAGEPFLKAVGARARKWAEDQRAGLSWSGGLLLLWRAVPLALLVLVVVASLSADGPDRRIWLLLPILAAALLFVAPGGIAVPGVRFHDPVVGALRAPRVTLALATVASIVIVIARDELWLAAVAVLATVLGLLCLAVAATSGRRFAPYGLAVLIAVPLFGAAATLLRGVDSPELQPAAVLLQSGKGVCGAYVGESDGRLWMARITLDERATVRRPRRGAIFSIPSERIRATTIGALEPVASVETRAAVLRNAMLDERGEDNPAQRPPTCRPPRDETTPVVFPPPPGAAEEGRRLAELADRYQPELVIDRRDGFWPVPVRTLLAMRDRRATICRQPAVAASECLRLGTPGEFPWAGGRGEHLEYPAADDDREEQYDLMVDALGTADPSRSALIYFLATRKPGPDQPITIQYWFFYPFNYQPTKAVPDGGYHEGDFESIALLLSAKTNRPRYIWMARHDEEGRIFPWDDEAIVKNGEHPELFAARGSHATYESCARQSRPAGPVGLIDDYPACDAGRPLRLAPETTPLADLSRVGWACWAGLFGHASGGLYKQLHLIGDAPRSPLWQQDFGVVSEPCRGVPDPGGRDGPDEEVLEESKGVPALLRRRSGSIAPLVDRCSDWEKPAVTGTYIVACDQEALDAYLASGLERTGPAGVRIDLALPDAPKVGAFALPAMRRNPAGSYLDVWRIVAANPTEVSVFASCPRRGANRAIGAKFERVRVMPGRPLRLLDHGPDRRWRLVAPDGAKIADAVPFTTRVEGGGLVPAEPHPGLRCGRPDD